MTFLLKAIVHVVVVTEAPGTTVTGPTDIVTRDTVVIGIIVVDLLLTAKQTIVLCLWPT